MLYFLMGHIQIYGSIPAMGKTPQEIGLNASLRTRKGGGNRRGVIVLEN
jgi:hypothetical protein